MDFVNFDAPSSVVQRCGWKIPVVPYHTVALGLGSVCLTSFPMSEAQAINRLGLGVGLFLASDVGGAVTVGAGKIAQKVPLSDVRLRVQARIVMSFLQLTCTCLNLASWMFLASFETPC